MLDKGFAAAVKKEKFGCIRSHAGPNDCKLAPEDGLVQQKCRGIYAPLPPICAYLKRVFTLVPCLFRIDRRLVIVGWRLGHAVYKFAKLGLGQRADFGIDGIAAFKHD